VAGARRYVIDTNVYIDALRVDQDRFALSAFLTSFTPFVWLSAVVAQELRSGVRGQAARRLEDGMLAPFERRGRLITPSYGAWKEAGRVLSELVAPDGWASVSRSFVNDVLLALSCREAGVTLVTRNTKDFARIAGVRDFQFVDL
jgi:predicted nucleic acid-binding protein